MISRWRDLTGFSEFTYELENSLCFQGNREPAPYTPEAIARMAIAGSSVEVVKNIETMLMQRFEEGKVKGSSVESPEAAFKGVGLWIARHACVTCWALWRAGKHYENMRIAMAVGSISRNS